MYQSCTIIGNLGGDAELRYTQGGQAVSNCSVAVNERWHDREGQLQEKTTWFRVALWGKLAESLTPYLVRGKQVLVEGTIDASSFTGRDGEARASLELRARTVRLLGGRDDGEQRQAGPGYVEREIQAQARREPQRQAPPLTDEDIPF